MADVKILLVEDESIEAMDIKRILESFGYNVPYIASNSDEAVKKALEIMPDLILMDIILKGGIDGNETVSKIKDLNIPIIYLTAHSEESTIERAKLTEPYGYIIKPYDRTEIKYAIELAIYKNQIDRELKEGENKFYLLFENSPLPYQSLDKHGVLLEVNPAWLDILGYSKDEVIGKHFVDLLAPGYAEHFNKNFPYFKNAGEIHEVEFEIKHKNGSNILVSYEGKIGYDELGNFKQTNSIFHNITQQKKVEKTLKESEEKFRAIAENAIDAILIAVEKGKHVYVNPKAAELTGYSKDELVTTQIEDIAHPDEIINLKQRYNLRMVGENIPATYETRIVRKDNKIVPIEISAAKTIWKGQPAVMVQVRDITKRKKIEEKIELASLYNRSLIEASLDPLVTIGPDGKVTDVNKATEIVTGYSRNEIIGSDFSDYFTEPEKAKKGYKKVFKDGFVKDYPLEIQNLNGHNIPVLYNASVYKDEFGKVVGVFAAARDISQIMETEKNIQMLANVVESTDDAIITKSLDGIIQSWNKGAEQIYGYAAKEVIGKNISILTPKHLKSEILKLIEKIKKCEKIHHYETLRLKKDGTLINVSITLSPVVDTKGKLIAISTIARDISENKKIEKKLNLASLYNRSLIEASLDPLVTIGSDGKINDVNSATETVTGYSRDKLIGSVFSDYFTKPVKAKEGYLQVFKEGFVRDYPLEIQHKDGHVTPVLYNASVYLDESRNVVGVFAAARDITEHKKAEDALRESEEKYRDIFEESFDGLFITSPDGKILDMNKKGIEMFGYSTKEEILSLNLVEDVYADPKDRNKVLAMVNGQGSAEYEVVVKKKNEDRMITRCSLTAVKDKGVITSYRGVIRDITKSKKAENDIIHAKEEWENTFDAVPDLIAILDTNFRVVRANNAMADRLNVTPEETVGITCYEVVHGMNSEPSFCPYSKLLEDGKEHTAEVHEQVLGGDFIVSVSPLHDNDGKLSGVVHVARDITRRKKTENEIKKSLDEKEVLLREIHHRVKNNLQIIASLLNLQESENEEVTDILRESMGRVKTMATIHEKLYESPSLNEIDFKEFTEKLVYDILYSYGIQTGTIKTELCIENIKFNIDTAIPLGLIINELVTNSIKYAFPLDGGTITIKLRTILNNFELIISDNGIGIPKNIDPRNTTTLGLRLVTTLINQLEGKLKININNGTEFKIIFKKLEYKKRI